MKKIGILLGIIGIILVLFYGYWLNNVVLEKEKQKQKEFPKEIPGIEPYRGELPPLPDKKLNDSTLLGIDSNANGVRDDLEIEIVETYGADKMVVEAFFAYVRSDALDFKIVAENRFTDELYKNDIKGRINLSSGCRSKYLYESVFIDDITEVYDISINFHKKINNSTLRKNNADTFSSHMNNRFFVMGPVTYQECELFFEETKKFKLY